MAHPLYIKKNNDKDRAEGKRIGIQFPEGFKNVFCSPQSSDKL
jgi:hypothetical protein